MGAFLVADHFLPEPGPDGAERRVETLGHGNGVGIAVGDVAQLRGSFEQGQHLRETGLAYLHARDVIGAEDVGEGRGSRSAHGLERSLVFVGPTVVLAALEDGGLLRVLAEGRGQGGDDVAASDHLLEHGLGVVELLLDLRGRCLLEVEVAHRVASHLVAPGDQVL